MPLAFPDAEQARGLDQEVGPQALAAAEDRIAHGFGEPATRAGRSRIGRKQRTKALLDRCGRAFELFG